LRDDFATCCGAAPTTPAIDALAARGQRFTNAVGSFHQTTMSMGALFTGQTPSLERSGGEPLNFNSRTWCGMARFAMWDEPGCLPRALRTLPERMQDAGYETIGIASNRLLFEPAGFERGFDRWVEVSYRRMGRKLKDRELELARVQGRAVDRVTMAALYALHKRASDRFFLYVHYMDVHDYLAGRDWFESWGELRGDYASRVERVDAGVGLLLNAFEKEGLLEDTAFVFTADHGERLGEEHLLEGRSSHWGEPSFEEVLRIPLIVAPPRFEDTDRLVRTEDIFRMVSAIAGEGGEEASALETDELFLGEGPWWTYRSGRFKSFASRDGKSFHLVDLAADPAEVYDVAALHPEIGERHRARVAELVDSLAATGAVPEELTPEDQERLRALGYLD
jgi:arylsulfatase A-like enzyme